MDKKPAPLKPIRPTFHFDAVCRFRYPDNVLTKLAAGWTFVLCACLVSTASAQSSSMKIIRIDANGQQQVQSTAETRSVTTPQGSIFISSASKPAIQGQSTRSTQTTATTAQAAPDTQRSESTTQVRDSSGNVKTISKTIMTETRSSSDTVQTETTFQEGRPMSGELETTARMREVKKETSDGETYQRVLETRTGNGDFRPKQKIEAETRKYGDGSSKTRSVESSFDLYGNSRPTQETVERQSAESFGRQFVERFIHKIEAGGGSKLERVEVEQKNPRATSGVVDEKVVKQPDSSSTDLRETQRVTTSVGTYYSGVPYKMIVTTEYPRNDRSSPVITQVVIEKTMRHPDGSTYIERELKVRDLNGNLTTLTVTQIDSRQNRR